MSEPKTREPQRSANYYSPSERALYGVTATLVNTRTQETRVEVARGGLTTREAVGVIVRICDQLGPEWKVRVLSHPNSILGDLRNQGDERATQTEGTLLGAHGRLDLVEKPPWDAGIRTRAIRRRRRREAA